ncbi:hypothetical protein JL722_13870 [Aureococcus anophagefferens]|nr:hypothetical protein JL722_13870 [Aureococcus anophagefferens]
MSPAPHADDRSDPDLAEAAREAALIAEENRILNTDLRMDADTVMAGLLHDTVEDTSLTVGDIQATFGDAVARIVEGVTDEPPQIEQ